MRREQDAVNLKGSAWVDRLRLALRECLMPSLCLLCDARVSPGNDLCQACSSELPWLQNACLCCALPLSEGGVCGQCLNKPPPQDRVWSPLLYRPPVDAMLRRLKFRGDLACARMLGGLMARSLVSCRQDFPEILVPVPLHSGRIRERGFNQAIELARPLSKALAIPIGRHLCVRSLLTEAQAGLSAQARRRNVRGVFKVKAGPMPRHIAIIDDVMTTGATTMSLASSFRQAGVAHIEIWVCARTPE